MNITFTGIIELSQKTRLSKFPVYKTSIDDIQGVLHVKDMMRFAQDRPSFSVKDCMRQPLFVLETRKMSSIQQILRENNQTIAIVDEYSGIAGLLTIEDIAQEIFELCMIRFFSLAGNSKSGDRVFIVVMPGS